MRQHPTTETGARPEEARRRLVWGLAGGIGPDRPPTDDSFYIKDGRRFLRSRSWEMMTVRQKQRSQLRPSWYSTVYEDVDYVETEEGDCDVFTWHTPVGSVVGRRLSNHFVEYPLKSVDDLDAWIYVHRNVNYRLNESWFESNDPGKLETLPGLSWSPVQQLLQFDTGLSSFYYFLMDAPEKMADLLEVMQERCMDRLRLGLRTFPESSWVYWGENTSSSGISPQYYRQLTLPHIREYSQLVHSENKRLIVHMCGLLRDLMDLFVLTGMDGIDSVTPPPLGDTPYRLVQDTFGPEFKINGRLNAHLWVGRSKKEIQANARQMIYPELLDSPFRLSVTDDVMPNIPYEDVMVLYEALESMDW